jgi:hypothetical protein
VARRPAGLKFITDSAYTLGNLNVSDQLLAVSAGTATTPGSAQRVVTIFDAATGKLLWRSSGTTENFLRIGHSLFTLVLAFFGGHVSRWFYVGNRQPDGSDMSRVTPASEA